MKILINRVGEININEIHRIKEKLSSTYTEDE